MYYTTIWMSYSTRGFSFYTSIPVYFDVFRVTC